MKSLIEDKDGNVCGAKTWFSVASAIILFKYAVSELTIAGMTFGNFDAAGASMLLGAFGAVYFGRSHTKAN